MASETGTLIVLDVPAGTELGINLKYWTVGAKFKGIQLIPEGLHFIYYGVPRMGFWHSFKKGELLVRKWCCATETISNKDDISRKEFAEVYRNLSAFQDGLGIYPSDIHQEWCFLTDCISEDLMKQLNPKSGNIHSVNINNAPSEENRINWTHLPIKKSFPVGCTASDISQHYLDRIYAISTILEMNFKNAPMNLIGEFQMCYICFLIGHSLDAFIQWKQLVKLLCSSQKAIQKYPELYTKFVTVLQLHTKEMPEEFLGDLEMNNNFIYYHLRQLFRNVNGIINDNNKCDLTRKIEDFKRDLSHGFQWDFSRYLESDDEEEAPVIVVL